MADTLTLQEWIGEILLATYELTLTQFGQQHYRVSGAVEKVECEDPIGGYIPVISEEEAFLFGILTDKRGGRELTKYFIQAESDAVDVQPADMADIIRETLNIICGMVKRQLVERHSVIKAGFPVFSGGSLAISPGHEHLCVRVEIGSMQLYVLVIRTDSFSLPTDVQAPEAAIDLKGWLDEMLTATFRVAPLTLGRIRDLRMDVVVNEYGSQDKIYGAYLPLIGGHDAILIGLLSTPDGFREVVKVFWGSEDPDVTMGDVADAGKEVLNILAGMIRRQLSEKNLRFRMGVPIFMEGYLEVGAEEEAACALIEVTLAKVHLVVIRKKRK